MDIRGIDALPVRAVLPQVAAALSDGRGVVLQAPPGTGKTLLTAPFLLGSPWLGDRRIILLEPRRIAARMAAQAMASVVGCRVGGTVGYQVRLERRIGPDTRIEVLTEGLLAKRLLRDPELSDVGLVIFDEFHERSIHADFGMALALDARSVLRPDLRILVMSATLDAEATARMLGDGTAIVRAEARTWPVETIHVPPQGEPRMIADGVARCVGRAIAETEGGILAFLPGEGEIRRAESLLRERGLPAGVDLLPLYGALPKAMQDAAVAPPAPGRRKVVLSTSIAESSLTIQGIGVVIDCGWTRVSRFSHSTGMSRLETIRVTRDRADQRRGRAGRLGPGVCYRLWDAITDSALQDEAVPEIVNADLAPLRLDAAAWGAREPGDIPFPTPPPEHSWRTAGSLLMGLEALDADGRITARGRRMAEISAHPRLAHMIDKARDAGAVQEAALCAAIVEEAPSAPFLRDYDDLRVLCDMSDGGVHAAAQDRRQGGGHGGENAAAQDRAQDGGYGGVHAAAQDRAQGGQIRDWAARVLAIAAQWTRGAASAGGAVSAGRLLSWAYPDRVAQCRDGGALYRLASGHGARLAEGSGLWGERTIVAASLQDSAADAAIRLAAPVNIADIEADFAHLIENEDVVRWNAQADRIVAVRRRRIGSLVLSEKPLADPPDGERVAALADGIRRHGVANLGWTRHSRALQARLAFVKAAVGGDWPDVSDEALEATIGEWLGRWLDGARSWDDIVKVDLSDPLMALAEYRKRELDALAPEFLALPCGHRARIDYGQGDRPVISAKLQDFFGLNATPLLAKGRVRAKISLLSPAQRPVAVTDDLERFWREGYPLVRKEMRGRYPKHKWPEDPRGARQ